MDSRKRNFKGRGYLVSALLAATLVSVLFIPADSAWAQGEGADECTFGLTVNDYTCDGRSSCESSTFTAPCSEPNYYLDCRVICTSGDPTYCRVTAKVVRVFDGAILAVCQTWDEEGCGANQTVVENIALVKGEQYRLNVCLDACYGHTCPDCVNCRAFAQIRHD